MRPTLLLFKQVAFYTVERKSPLGWRNIPQGFIIMQDYQVGYVIKSVLWCQCHNQGKKHHFQMLALIQHEGTSEF